MQRIDRSNASWIITVIINCLKVSPARHYNYRCFFLVIHVKQTQCRWIWEKKRDTSIRIRGTSSGFETHTVVWDTHKHRRRGEFTTTYFLALLILFDYSIQTKLIYVNGTGKTEVYFSIIHDFRKTCLVSLYDSLSYFLPSVYTIIQVGRLERLPMH